MARGHDDDSTGHLSGSASKRVRASRRRGLRDEEDLLEPQGQEQEEEEQEEAHASQGSEQALQEGDEEDGPFAALSVKNIAQHAFAKAGAANIERVPSQRGTYLDRTVANGFVGNVMRLVLFCNLTRQKCTTKKIKDLVMDKVPDIKVTKPGRTAIMHLAMQRFRHLFGYWLVCTAHAPVLASEEKTVKTTKRRKTAPQDEPENKRMDSDSDNWILLDLEATTEEKIRNGRVRKDNAKRGLVMVILAALMVNEGTMQEGVLKEMMTKQLKVDAGGFGDAAKALKDLEAEGYLLKRKGEEKDAQNEKILEYTYGPRTVLEVGLPNVFKFIQSYNGDVSKQDAERMLATIR